MTTRTKAKSVSGKSSAGIRSVQRIATDQSARLFKALERLFVAVRRDLPQGNLTIEDLIIKGDQLVVKYKSADSPVKEISSFLTDVKTVAVDGLEVFNLGDGRVVEHQDTVYQIKTS